MKRDELEQASDAERYPKVLLLKDAVHYQNRIKIGVAMILLGNFSTVVFLKLLSAVNDAVIILLGGIGTLGLVMLFAGLMKGEHKPRWAFWFMLFYAFFLASNPPTGTAIAGFIWVYLIRSRRSFFVVPRKGDLAEIV